MIKKVTLFTTLSVGLIMSAQAMSEANTLGGNDTISNSLIENQVDESAANALLNTPYKGFYEIRSKIKNSRITFDKVVSAQSFPDARWKDMARDIASLVELPAYSTGSRIEPKATAYVAFYDADMSGLDRSKVMLLPTTTDADPNTLVVLVIKHKNYSRTQDVRGTSTGSSSENGNNIFFFELAM